MKASFLIILMSLIYVSCSSTTEERQLEEVEHQELQKDYIVRDASSKFRPGWLEDAEIWARNNNLNLTEESYFSFETSPKTSRTLSCDIAKANVSADIASIISNQIVKEIALVTEGTSSIDENNPEVEAASEFASKSLAQKIQATIHGSQVIKIYWEKRYYKKDLGAKKDFIGWTCASLVRMKKEQLKKLVDQATKLTESKIKDGPAKDKVHEALKDIGDKL